MQLRFPQAAVDRSFRKLFPHEYVSGVKFPNLEEEDDDFELMMGDNKKVDLQKEMQAI